MPERDEYACPCCGQNRIQDGVVDLVNSIQSTSGLSVHVNSGYRCARNNAAVGGEPNSYHMRGMAADISCGDLSRLSKACRALWNSGRVGGLGIYHSFRHVDIGPHRSWGG